MDNMEIDSRPVMVSIRCLTYNQEKYIRDCLEGFVMQKTNFRFEAIVHDDASTDGTAAIIREYAKKYPDIITPIYQKENQYSKHNGSLRRIMDSHMRGKYIAFCEGDDYWIDENKLQRQVDFLESHSEYSLSTENGFILYTNSNKAIPFSNLAECDLSLEDILKSRKFPTASVLYRQNLNQDYSKLSGATFDTKLWAYLATKGKVHFSPIISSVYRRGTGVTESNKIKWAFTSYRFNQAIDDNFQVSSSVKKTRQKTLFYDLLSGYKSAKIKNDSENRKKIFFRILKSCPILLLQHYFNQRKKRFCLLKTNLKETYLNIYYKYIPCHQKIQQTSRTPQVIVSLTSYSARFSTLPICLKSLMNQSFKPDQLILYVTQKDATNISNKISKLTKNGLTIKIVNDDLKPHKKYFYAMQEHPNDIIITVDDDVIYPKDTIETLYKNYLKFPNAISARRVHYIHRDLNGKNIAYKDWTQECSSEKKPSFNLCAIGVGGILYPPHLFHFTDSYFNKDNIIKYCLTADDIWLKFIENKEKIPVCWVTNKKQHPYKIKDNNLSKTALENDNICQGKNDEAIKNCERFFGISL